LIGGWLSLKHCRIKDMCGSPKNGFQEIENIIIAMIADTILNPKYI
jgi:hypothetical protein